MTKLRVTVNGYGVIGKRVADAVQAQQEMELVCVADVGTDYRINTATVLGIDVYAAVLEKVSDMRNAGIPVKGSLWGLLSHVHVVADCTPKKIGAASKPLYEEVGVKHGSGPSDSGHGAGTTDLSHHGAGTGLQSAPSTGGSELWIASRTF